MHRITVLWHTKRHRFGCFRQTTPPHCFKVITRRVVAKSLGFSLDRSELYLRIATIEIASLNMRIGASLGNLGALLKFIVIYSQEQVRVEQLQHSKEGTTADINISISVVPALNLTWTVCRWVDWLVNALNHQSLRVASRSLDILLNSTRGKFILILI